MQKKMRAEESEFTYDVPALKHWMAEGGGGQTRLQLCHLVAWVLAQRSHAPDSDLRTTMIVETRWLKALGMTRAGLEDVRQWQFEYYVYDTADDNMKAKTVRLFERSPRDEALLKTYLHLIDMYRRERVMLLSEQVMRAQQHALRAALVIEPYSATLPALGMVHYCVGCRGWACVLEKPAAEATAVEGHAPAAQRRYADWCDLRQRALQVRHHPPQDWHYMVTCGLLRSRGRTSAPTEESAEPQQSQQQQQQKRIGVGAVVSLRGAHYHPLDGQLYCRRGYRTTGRHGVPYDEHHSSSSSSSSSDDEEDMIPLEEEEEDTPEEEELLDDVESDNVQQWARQLQHLGTADAPSGARSTKKKNSNSPDIASLLLERAQWCKRPLVAIDMPGTAKQLHNHTVVLCGECGKPCELSNHGVTNGGFSCALHPLLAERGKHMLLWRTLDMPAEVVESVVRVASGQEEQRRVARLAGPCFVCGDPQSVVQVWAYDLVEQLVRVPICQIHRTILAHRFVPLQETQLRQGAPPPVPLGMLLACTRGDQLLPAS